jgi:hypothetical protein
MVQGNRSGNAENAKTSRKTLKPAKIYLKNHSNELNGFMDKWAVSQNLAAHLAFLATF